MSFVRTSSIVLLVLAAACDCRGGGLREAPDGGCPGGVCATVTCPAAATVKVGEELTLTGKVNDAYGEEPTTWSVTQAPSGSLAMPATPDALATRFTPDVTGAFTLQLCTTLSPVECCTTEVSVMPACSNPPPPPASTACVTSWDGRPIVQFAAVPAGLTYQLVDGTGKLLATATEGHNHLRPATRIAPGAAPPGQAVMLSVRSCTSNDLRCCSNPTAVSVSVVSVCTSPVAPTTANVVLSEYVVNGEGTCPSVDCMTQDTCQAGEAVEITNLSNCPVALNGHHFAYRNANAASASYRWMNFGPADVIPPRGVYVAIRSRMYGPTCSAPLGAESAGLYGLNISSLNMQGSNLCNGWFNNNGGGMSELRLARGVVAMGDDPTFTGAAIARIAPYLGSTASCSSVGFDAVDSCGSVMGGTEPTATLQPNQLGRLWHPCDAVVNPAPACVRD